MYQPIDQIKTGAKIKAMLRAAGYEVKDIQKYLHLSCPQSIYRWFKGNILPSVEHLCALSKLLDVHMEDLLIVGGFFCAGKYGWSDRLYSREHKKYKQTGVFII